MCGVPIHEVVKPCPECILKNHHAITYSEQGLTTSWMGDTTHGENGDNGENGENGETDHQIAQHPFFYTDCEIQVHLCQTWK